MWSDVQNQELHHVSLPNANGLMPPLQSAYRRHHSTETALLKLLSDVYGAIDCQQVALLGLLDLSADFNCVDHEILLRRLRSRFRVHGSAYDWVSSFLYGRSQQVFYKGRLSAKLQLLFGVPQGPIRPYFISVVYSKTDRHYRRMRIDGSCLRRRHSGLCRQWSA